MFFTIQYETNMKKNVLEEKSTPMIASVNKNLKIILYKEDFIFCVFMCAYACRYAYLQTVFLT